MSRIYVGDKPVKAVMIDGKKYTARVRNEGAKNILYQLPTPVMFTGNIKTAIDTGFKLWEKDISFTIMSEFVCDIKTTEQALFSAQQGTGVSSGLKWGWHPNQDRGYYMVAAGSGYRAANMSGMPRNYTGECKLKITHRVGSMLYTATCVTPEGEYSGVLANVPFVAHSKSLLIGADWSNISLSDWMFPWTGLVKSFNIIGGDPV